MNKLLFDASGNVQGPISVAGHYQYEQDYEGKKSVLSFIKNGDSLKIPESQIKFDGESDYLEFNFRADTPPEAETKIVSGSAIPFTLGYSAGDKGLMLHAQLITDADNKKYVRECESQTPLKYATWYNVKIVFVHDEYFVLIDDKPHLRRIYRGTWRSNAQQNLVFGGGKPAGLHVCDIALSENIFEESSAEQIEKTLGQMNDTDFMEIDSCLRDCALDGIVLQGTGSKVTIDGKACTVYTNGAIVFDYDDKAIYLPLVIYKYYANHIKETGRPIAYTSYTCEEDNNLIQFGLFTNQGVFYNVTKSKTTVIGGDILKRFLNCDLKAYKYWYPTYTSDFEYQGRNEYAGFSTGLVIYSVQGQTFLLSAAFHNYLQQDNTLNKTGLPVDDYRVGVNSKGVGNYEALECQKGTIHSTDTFQNYFTDKKLGAPVKLDGEKEVSGLGTIHYYDFENGVIVLYPGQTEPVTHNGLNLRFREVTTGKIDDAINKTAELYMKLTLYGNGKVLENGTELGKKSYSNGSPNYVWGAEHNNYKLTPLHGDSSFHIRIKLYDYDPESGADYLGTFDYVYSIANGWGVDEYGGADPQHGIHTLIMTDEGKDNENGLGNNKLKLTLSEVYDMPTMLKDIRKNFSLPFCNFKGSYPFDYEKFTNVFTNTNKLTLGYLNYILHPLDAIFYGISCIALDGAKCFGFATSELLALHELGPFCPSLSQYEAAPGYDGNYGTLQPSLADPICDYYLYQCGWDYIMWRWRKINANEFLIAHSSIQSIIDRLDKESYCVIDIAPASLSGHAVMAYGYKKIKSSERLANGNYKLGNLEIKADYDYLIYVADCNAPYDKYEQADTYSVIAFEKKNSVKDWVKVYYVRGGSSAQEMDYKDYCYIHETPFSILSKPPRVPNLVDIIVDSITEMVAGWFDGAAEQVQISDPATNEVLYDKQKEILKGDRIMVFRNSAADGKDRLTGFLLKGKDVSVKFRAARKEKVELHVAGRETDAGFKADLTQGEELNLSLRNIHRPERFTADIRSSEASKAVQSEISFVDRRDKTTRNTFSKKLTVGKGGAKLAAFNVGSRMKIDGSTVKSTREAIKASTSRAQEIALKRNYPGAVILNRQLTTTQVSRLYHVATSTARSYCRQGLIPGATKVNRRWSIPAENNATK